MVEPLLPKVQGEFAEFLQWYSLIRLCTTLHAHLWRFSVQLHRRFICDLLASKEHVKLQMKIPDENYFLAKS